MEGFGNQKSDVDVYVICKKIPEQYNPNKINEEESLLWEDGVLVRNLVFEGVRYDFEYWTEDDFLNLIEKLNKLNFKTDGYIQRFSDSEIDLLHRFKFSKPIVNIDNFNTIKQSTSFRNLDYYLGTVNTEKFTSYLEDIQGALLSNDFGSAYFMVRRLLELAVTSYLSVHGETNPNLKWMYRKILSYQRRTGDENLLDKYVQFQTYPFEESKIQPFIKKVIGFSQNLNVKTQNILKECQI